MSEQIKEIVKKGKELHQEIKLQSQQLAKYLDFLKLKASQRPSFVPCGGCMGNKIDARPSLIRAVNSLSEKQRADFYLKNVQLSNEIQQQKGQKTRPFTEQSKSITWNFFNEADKEWQAKQIEINYNKLCIKFRSTKEQIYLHNYILRGSKKRDKNRKVLALQSIQNLQLPQTLRISNFKENFEDFAQSLTTLADQALRDNIIRMTSTDSSSILKTISGVRLSKRQANQSPIGKQLVKKTSTIDIAIPSEENIYEKETNTNRNGLELFRTSPISGETKQLMKILNNQIGLEVYRHNALSNATKNRLRKLYEYTDDLSYLTFEWLSDNFMNSSSFRRWKKSLKEARTLSFNRDSKKKVFFELHQYKESREQISYVFTRQKIQLDGNTLFFFDLPADQIKYQPGKGTVEYTVWKIVRKGEKVTIECQAVINHGQKKKGMASIKLTDQFLGNFDCICSNLDITLGQDTEIMINSVAFEEEYLSEIDSFNDGQDDIDDFYSIDQNVQQQTAFNDRDRSFSFKKDNRTNNAQLNHDGMLAIPEIKSSKDVKPRHINQALPKQAPIFKYPNKKGQHPYFQDEFSFSPEGQMISINEQKLKAQSSVLKDIIKSIGRNLFSGKSILNMSLPVTVFSVQSNLSLLCKSYSYAPFLLQKAASQKDPVHRLKYIAAFLASVTIAYLQMDKPFNPILGETFQAVFDGCPVYGQQVSHHPPISSTFMIGRGYRLYGSFQAKVNIGINSAVGSNQGILNICFDNNNLSKKLIKVKYPPGEVTGLTIGVRKVAATQKGYILDVENRLFIEMNFNKFKGVTQYCKFFDGMQGRIVKLSPSADLQKLEKIQKKHIIQQYGIVNGRWTHQIFYDDELIFNSWEHMPYQYVPYLNPLPSHAYFREDLIFRIKNDYITAQSEKERLQQLQRNDRKLREKYTGKKH